MAGIVRPTLVTGPYKVEWSTGATLVDLGRTDNSGVRIRISPYFEKVTTDAGGMSTVDLVNQGGDVFVEFTMVEFATAYTTQDILLPSFDDRVLRFPDNVTNNVGAVISATCQQLKFTPLPQGGSSTRIYTFHKCYPISELDFTLWSKYTRLPLVFQAFPDETTNNDDILTVTT